MLKRVQQSGNSEKKGDEKMAACGCKGTKKAAAKKAPAKKKAAKKKAAKKR